MKRTISLVIALTLSFVMMFSSIAKAEEIKVPISLEPTKLEAVKVPAAKTNKADALLAQAKASDRVLEEGEQTSVRPTQNCSFMCSNGRPGNFKDGFCDPC